MPGPQVAKDYKVPSHPYCSDLVSLLKKWQEPMVPRVCVVGGVGMVRCHVQSVREGEGDGGGWRRPSVVRVLLFSCFMSASGMRWAPRVSKMCHVQPSGFL